MKSIPNTNRRVMKMHNKFELIYEMLCSITCFEGFRYTHTFNSGLKQLLLSYLLFNFILIVLNLRHLTLMSELQN